MPLSTIIIQHHGIGWALCWHTTSKLLENQPKKQNNKQNNKQLTLRFFTLYFYQTFNAATGTMTERWTKGALLRSRMYDMMKQTSMTNTGIMNTHRPFVYYPHSRWTQPFSVCNNVITLGHTNDVCTAIGELFYYFIVIQVVPSLVPLFQDSIVRDLAGEWTWSSHLILLVHPSPSNEHPIDHSKLCFGSSILRRLIHLFTVVQEEKIQVYWSRWRCREWQ